ncbi:MAG: MarR family winged helix-turn-helix transcriptional regulator [Actinomycetales bacterium]
MNYITGTEHDVKSEQGEEPGAAAVRRVVPGWESTRTLTLLQELIDVASAAPAAVARRADLSTSELHSLRHLSNRAMGPADLARLLGVTTAASSGIVDRLAANGHVERRPHPQDGRRTVVQITDSGRAEVLANLAPMFRGLAQLDGALSQDDRAVVDRYLDGAIAAIRSVL